MTVMFTKGPIVYFHGLPGGPSEIGAFGHATHRLVANCHIPNRRMINKGTSLSDHFDSLAAALKIRFANSALRFVGFSLGAYVALEVASRMGPAVEHISLVSAGAPLSMGRFLPDMAGQTVFRAAGNAPMLFAVLTWAQALASQIAPDQLFEMLFASARGSDRELRAQPLFRAKIIKAMRDCLGNGASGYRQELRGYVQDWAPTLPLVTQPVEIWHGSLDNWAPFAMAEALADALPNVMMLHRLEEQSHYSTLQVFLR